jgi:hypothetical protein
MGFTQACGNYMSIRRSNQNTLAYQPSSTSINELFWLLSYEAPNPDSGTHVTDGENTAEMQPTSSNHLTQHPQRCQRRMVSRVCGLCLRLLRGACRKVVARTASLLIGVYVYIRSLIRPPHWLIRLRPKTF